MAQQKIFLIFVGGIAAAILVIAGTFYWISVKNSEAQRILEEQRALKQLNQSLEQVGSNVGQKIPSVNPLDKVTVEDPIGKINPFKNAYQNPFE